MTTGQHQPLNILLVSGEYPPDPGGVGDYTRLLARALLARGHAVTVATGRSSVQAPDQPDESPVVAIAGGWSWRSLRSLQAAIAHLAPDIVHIQYQTGAYQMRPAIMLLPWYLRRQRRRPRVVVTMHDLRVPYLFPKAGPLRHWLTRRLLLDADAVIVTNDADRDTLAGTQRTDPDIFRTSTPIPARVIPIGSNVAPEPPPDYNRAGWRAANGFATDDLMIAFFGLASPSKGLLPLVQAVAALPPHVHLLVVGGEAQQPQDREYLATVQAAIAQLELSRRISITGHCDAQSVSAHLLASDLAVLPFGDGASYRRGSLLAVLAHALPLITTHPETTLQPPLLDGEHALLVPPDDVDALIAAIRRLEVNPDLRTRIGVVGQRLLQQFAWPTIAAAHEEGYNLLRRPTTNDQRPTTGT